MKRPLLYSGLVLIILSLIARMYAAQYTHITADGVLHDSLWLPISALMLIIGILMLFVTGTLYVIGYLRGN